jgi:hypothetical protein
MNEARNARGKFDYAFVALAAATGGNYSVTRTAIVAASAGVRKTASKNSEK